MLRAKLEVEGSSALLYCFPVLRGGPGVSGAAESSQGEDETAEAELEAKI